MRVYRDGVGRSQDDGYRCELAPGLRSSEDARRLAVEAGFAGARLWELARAPSGLYGIAAGLAEAGDLELASWTCFVVAYLSPKALEESVVEVRRVVDGTAGWVHAIGGAVDGRAGAADGRAGAADGTAGGVLGMDGGGVEGMAGGRSLPGRLEEVAPALERVQLGSRSSHDRGRGVATLEAYLEWAGRAGSQACALAGDEEWSPERRFERIFERLAIPGFGRSGRFDLLVSLGWLGLYEMRADSLHLATAGPDEPALLAAKRVFGIGDPHNLERRAARLAEVCEMPIEALELGLFNWASGERATLGVSAGAEDEGVREKVEAALGL